jgi:hypothetical protein
MDYRIKCGDRLTMDYFDNRKNEFFKYKKNIKNEVQAHLQPTPPASLLPKA